MNEEQLDLATVPAGGISEDVLREAFYESDVEFAWGTNHTEILVHSENAHTARSIINKIYKQEGVIS